MYSGCNVARGTDEAPCNGVNKGVYSIWNTSLWFHQRSNIRPHLFRLHLLSHPLILLLGNGSTMTEVSL